MRCPGCDEEYPARTLLEKDIPPLKKGERYYLCENCGKVTAARIVWKQFNDKIKKQIRCKRYGNGM